MFEHHTVVILVLALLQIDALIEQLGDMDIDARTRAVAALKACGRASLPKLEAVATDDVEVRERLRGVIAYLRALKSSRAIRVTFNVGVNRTIEAAEPGGVCNRVVRVGVVEGVERYTVTIDTGAPVEWHPDEYDGWRDVVLRDLERTIDTDVPAVYHLLVRADGFRFALERLASLRTDDPVMRRVIDAAIERQRRSP